ncbi:MAG: preprotein translocase subunit SecY [Minisyncoccia bacterium]
MNTFIQKIKVVFGDPTLRMRVFIMLGALAIFRLLATIPIPGVDTIRLQEFFSQNQFLGFMNLFSGGGLSNLSIVMLGVGPFITASIIMQVLTVVSPKMKTMYQEEGEAGRVKFTQWSRQLSIPLAFLQAFAFLSLLQNQGVVAHLGFIETFANVCLIAGGSVLLMWIGELITEFGIGNGVSLIIFAGIVSALPRTFSQMLFTFDTTQLPAYLGLAVLAFATTAAVVFITEAERPVPIMYARQSAGGGGRGGAATYLPIRVNQAGVIPIIFALSFLLIPQLIATVLASVAPGSIASGAQAVVAFLNSEAIYATIYFVLVFVFTYFYTAVTFDPDKIAENLQKSGGFVPGVRPGAATSEHLAHIITRTTFFGALFLSIIAVLPIAIQMTTGLTSAAIGGTALLIVVSVVLDVIKKVDAQLSIREY